MPSDVSIGALLQTLIASKPNGIFLELGTGTGLSLAWMLDGLGKNSKIISLDNNKQLIQVASEGLGEEDRLQLLCTEGELWLSTYAGEGFDLIFADTWPGKYYLLEKTLDMVKEGGFYVIDDMSRQANWPDGHEEKTSKLIETLDAREDFVITKMNWSTGIIIAVKKKK